MTTKDFVPMEFATEAERQEYYKAVNRSAELWNRPYHRTVVAYIGKTQKTCGVEVHGFEGKHMSQVFFGAEWGFSVAGVYGTQDAAMRAGVAAAREYLERAGWQVTCVRKTFPDA
jgi:hypothetical protein